MARPYPEAIANTKFLLQNFSDRTCDDSSTLLVEVSFAVRRLLVFEYCD
jgi:hypothetical protein